MIIPTYISYCVKCGEYGHIGKSCKNIDENKMNIILNNHQHAFYENTIWNISIAFK